ncbi:MAG: ABC transporter permease [Chitinophagaceae bacterium]
MQPMHHTEGQWTEVISPKSNLLDLKLKEVWRYRDLLLLFVKRDFISNYKQTILGPVWFFLQPLLTTLMFMLIFGRIAKIPIDIPPMVFYLSGITLWNYFAECLNKTATVFKDNANIFGKVYFPRLVMPLSIVISNLVRFGIQMTLFLIVWGWYWLKGDISPNVYIFLTPVLVMVMAIMGLGAGMIISSLTTKYRDLVFLLTFGVQLMMYATPVIMPLSRMPAKYQVFIKANPVTSLIEAFRYGFTGNGVFSWAWLLYSAGFALILLFVGTVIFNKVEKSFMDTV